MGKNVYFIDTWLPLLAAVYAAGLAILSNLENFYKYVDRAQAFRSVREILLSAGREYEMLWHTKVRAFSYSGAACMNASRVYKQLVEKDREIRAQVVEITETHRGPEK